MTNTQDEEYEAVKPCVCRAHEKAAEEKQHPRGFARAGEVLSGTVVSGKGQVESGKNSSLGTNHLPLTTSSGLRASDEEINAGAGIRYAAGRAALLDHPDREIAAIILNHRGKANAVKLEEIAMMLWPEEWQGKQGDRAGIEREIKKCVSRLFTDQKFDIGISRGDPPGYYLMMTREEFEENAAHTALHALAWIRRWKRFKPTAEQREKFFGQLRAEFEEVEKSKAETLNA